MQEKTARRLLWAAALFLVPVPLALFIGDPFVPAMRYLELALVVLITIFVEGLHGMAGPIFGLLGAHVLLYIGLFWLVAWVVARGLARLVPSALGPATLAIVALGIAVTATVPVYDSPFHARLPETTLLEVYE